jgi:Na+-driven multidrug efflux pump
MNTKILMTSSALVMALSGIAFSFLPHEIVEYFNDAKASAVDAVWLQILGALYFAFAAINWTAKANLIGGIYGRPIAVGNLTHFLIGGLVLIRSYLSSHEMTLLVPTLLYFIFGILFTIVFFRHPVGKKTDAT